MSFIKKIVNGSLDAPTVLKQIKTLCTTPMLINTDKTQGFRYAVPLECEEFQQTGSAQVSESLVIAKSSKVSVNDNVAPGAWTWELSGYIPGVSAIEVTNLYTPFVYLHTSFLRQWFKNGCVLKFRDEHAQYHESVVIQSLTIASQKDCANKQPFRMTLKEINVLKNASILDIVQENSIIENGSRYGDITNEGSTYAEVVKNDLDLIVYQSELELE